MFSVDSFYDFFVANYGQDKTNNIIFIFQPHGSKYLHDIVGFSIDTETILQHHGSFGKILLHDQEPFSLGYLDTYRNHLIERKKHLYDLSDDVKKLKFDSMGIKAQTLDSIELMKQTIHEGPLETHRSNIPPIFCHSEINSEDIDTLKDHGFIPCYYWWHAMIARDWYRHWKYYSDLIPINKSSCAQRFLLYSRAFDGTRAYRRKLVDHCARYRDLVAYNWEDRHVDSSFSARIDVADAAPPIHIVAETLFKTNKIYLTEKVFKPMVMSQAFIIAGPPKSLCYLRDYGFRTFADCWDESYDLEIDHAVRLHQICGLIRQLATMPQVEFDRVCQKALEIVRYNREHFYGQRFQDHVMSEFRSNLGQALFEQDQAKQQGLYHKP